jgi:hypothetical protein
VAGPADKDAGEDRDQADRRYRDRGGAQDKHQNGGRRDRGQTEPQYRSLWRGEVLMLQSQGAVLHGADDDRSDQDGGDPRGPHVGQKFSARQVEMAEHDQVGEVGARQEQGPGVGQQNAPVKERRLPFASTSGRVNEDRSQEGHRGVQVEDGGDGDDHDHCPDEEHHAGASGASQMMAGAGEQAVLVGNQADQQQSRYQHER